MILPGVLQIAAVLLLAIGTPRQARQIAPSFLDEPRRRWVRIVGMVVLALSLLMVLEGADRNRTIIGWAGAGGVAALIVALAFAVAGTRLRE